MTAEKGSVRPSDGRTARNGNPEPDGESRAAETHTERRATPRREPWPETGPIPCGCHGRLECPDQRAARLALSAGARRVELAAAMVEIVRLRQLLRDHGINPEREDQ